MFQIFNALLGNNHTQPKTVDISLPMNFNRYFSYAAVRLNEQPNVRYNDTDLRSIAYSLAHRQTSHYDAIIHEDSIFQPSNTIIHCMTVEGGSTVIYSHNDVKFYREFLSKQLITVYYPLALLSFIEYVHLLDLTTSFSSQISYQHIDTKSVESLREKILKFRLCYRFSQPSSLSIHNRFYEKWRIAFENEKLSQELYEDSSQINELLSYRQETEHEIKKEKSEKYLGIAGIIATTLLSITGVMGMNFNFYDKIEFGSWVVGVTLLYFIGVGLISMMTYLWILNDRVWEKKTKFLGYAGLSFLICATIISEWQFNLLTNIIIVIKSKFN